MRRRSTDSVGLQLTLSNRFKIFFETHLSCALGALGVYSTLLTINKRIASESHIGSAVLGVQQPPCFLQETLHLSELKLHSTSQRNLERAHSGPDGAL
ncbi:hypothetical protein Q7C36_008444 [Tachysurus vachellii]|uniref:Uncharacterized protein n=1 Tax=Tachysurus vachellii TaxID=175792 RepID=A0AA88SV41_TACVA|nr:hypothetical protein Q7C36_008444 [Tachysurus vachellii]